MSHNISRRMAELQQRLAPLLQFFTQSRFALYGEDPDACRLVTGDPQELALPEFVEALQRWAAPRDSRWYAYTMSLRRAQEAVAASLAERVGVPFEPDDIAMTNGAFTGLAAAMAALTDPGDEVVYVSPPWFFYEALILNAGLVPVRVRADPDTWCLDVDAVEAALGPRTRAVIINTPNNPTGRIYSAESLADLAARLEVASRRHGHAIYLLSDEAYCRILYDGHRHQSPAVCYPNTLLIYTYGKTLLAPGQRLGYIALPPTMPDREAVRGALMLAQLVTGYGYPNALLQHALADLERVSIDMGRLQARRDRMVAELRAQGYEVNVPEGTFYLLPRSPVADDNAFVEWLAERQVYVLPGALVEMPGYFRISLTANDEMVERALPVLGEAMEAARAGVMGGEVIGD